MSATDVTVRKPIFWHTNSATDKGLMRQDNEDAVLSRTEANVWLVADGMGGYEVGDVASDMVVKAIEEVDNEKDLNSIVNAVETKLIAANQRISEYSEIMLNGRTIGSTAVTLIIRGRVGVCLWVGDSRLYRLRNGQLTQLSRDHSQVEEMLQQGMIKPEDAANHPDLNVITRALGAEPEVYVDINVFTTQVGDVFLLCSDGLHNVVEAEDITETLSSTHIDQVSQRLIEQTINNGAPDNVSAIVVKGEAKAVRPAHSGC